MKGNGDNTQGGVTSLKVEDIVALQQYLCTIFALGADVMLA